MNVSIVIPVYNEAAHLKACLDAISLQTVRPLEVIVVDNNSSDTTTDIARSYGFVSLLHERRQGVVHARTQGFDAAKGDVIARIDADTVVPEDWVEKILTVFADPEVDAASGVALYYNVAAAPLVNAIDLYFRRRLSKRLKNCLYLWGANMAIRRSSWTDITDKLCYRGGLHEDFDLAIHLQEHGGIVRFDERMRAAVSSRRIDVGYVNFMKYVLKSPGTYAQHNIRERWHMYGVVLFCAASYIPARILHRGYDPQARAFRWRKVFTPATELTTPRVDPTAFVA
jgi:glycosyltransferase involved in cell wall biosynthesis